MVELLAGFIAALVITLGVIRWANLHPFLTHDHDVDGPQKFHAHAVPRVGGIGVLGGLVAAIISMWVASDDAWIVGATLMLCGLPVAGAGLAEDLTKGVSPRRRMLFAAISAGLAAVWLGTLIERTDIPGLDYLVTWSAGSFALTVFAVAGVSNAVNIIDGFNGLASMCVAIMLAGLAYVGFGVQDVLVAGLALAGVGAVLGFFVWNYPAGLVFLGDGGAYFLGYYLAELVLLLLIRNPDVSPLFPLLLAFYPIFETLFSIYRRRVIHLRSVGMPDGAHLHSLIHRRLLRWAAGERTASELTRRNSMTSPYLWTLCSLSVAPAVLWWNNTGVMAAFLLLLSAAYLTLYWRIVRFRSPQWLLHTTRRSRPIPLPPGDNRST